MLRGRQHDEKWTCIIDKGMVYDSKLHRNDHTKGIEWKTETHKNAQKQNPNALRARIHVRHGVVENELKEEFETRCWTKNEGIDLYSDSLNRPPNKESKHSVGRSEREREIEADCIEFPARGNYGKKEIWTRTECECVCSAYSKGSEELMRGTNVCTPNRANAVEPFILDSFLLFYFLFFSLFPSHSHSHSHSHRRTRICSMPVRHSMVKTEYKYGVRDNHHICIALAMYSLYYAMLRMPYQTQNPKSLRPSRTHTGMVFCWKHAYTHIYRCECLLYA